MPDVQKLKPMATVLYYMRFVCLFLFVHSHLAFKGPPKSICFQSCFAIVKPCVHKMCVCVQVKAKKTEFICTINLMNSSNLCETLLLLELRTLTMWNGAALAGGDALCSHVHLINYLKPISAQVVNFCFCLPFFVVPYRSHAI